MQELSKQEKINLRYNLAHCSDEYRKFYNGYLEVNKELGFKCNGADTYDHFDNACSENHPSLVGDSKSTLNYP